MSLGKRIVSFITAVLLLMSLSIITVVLYYNNNNSPVEYTEVTVMHGDTLWTIAKSAAPNVDPRKVVWEIQERNQIYSNKIYPGQTLKIPNYQINI
ncbi:MAG: LysM peptidoglycan-binding domain-containing protein [Firmicutes bacterium]|nr:LysM peptidoglycan-binding domain-containing protein [Bacillota bacterium]